MFVSRLSANTLLGVEVFDKLGHTDHFTFLTSKTQL